MRPAQPREGADVTARPKERAAYVALLAIAAAMLAGIALAGCSRTADASGASAASSASTARLWGYRGDAIAWMGEGVDGITSAVLVDQETGVEYLFVRYASYDRGGVSVTPLLNADGTPYKAVE